MNYKLNRPDAPWVEKNNEFAINRAIKMIGSPSEETIAVISRGVRSNSAIAQRVGMYLVGDFSRAQTNLAKLDEMLLDILLVK